MYMGSEIILTISYLRINEFILNLSTGRVFFNIYSYYRNLRFEFDIDFGIQNKITENNFSVSVILLFDY